MYKHIDFTGDPFKVQANGFEWDPVSHRAYHCGSNPSNLRETCDFCTTNHKKCTPVPVFTDPETNQTFYGLKCGPCFRSKDKGRECVYSEKGSTANGLPLTTASGPPRAADGKFIKRSRSRTRVEDVSCQDKNSLDTECVNPSASPSLDTSSRYGDYTPIAIEVIPPQEDASQSLSSQSVSQFDASKIPVDPLTTLWDPNLQESPDQTIPLGPSGHFYSVHTPADSGYHSPARSTDNDILSFFPPTISQASTIGLSSPQPQLTLWSSEPARGCSTMDMKDRSLESEIYKEFEPDPDVKVMLASLPSGPLLGGSSRAPEYSV